MNLRRASWIVGAAAVVLPAGYAFVQIRAFDEWAAKQGGVACGMPVVAILLLAVVAAATCSLLAVVLGVVAWRRQPGPRTLRRMGEIVLLAAPLILLAVLALQSPLLR